MKPESDRDEFREPFSDLKREDERGAPPFDRVWQAAATRKSARPRAAWGLAAAALVLLALGAVAALVWLRPSPERGAKPAVTAAAPGESEELAISQWQSPTAVLLEPRDGSQ